MRKGRFARSAKVALLVISLGTLSLVAFTPGAGALEPQETRVTPVILHACPSASGLQTAWGYNNTSAGNVVITQPDNDDDPRATFGDGDNDDNFFVPAPDTRPGQPNTFLPGLHGTDASPIVTTDEPAPTTWVTGNHVTTSNASLNCADVSILKTQLLDTVTVGQQEQYTLTVKNNGPTTASGVAVADALPAGTTPTAATTTAGSCTVTAPNVNCAIGTMTNGAIATVTITATTSATGSVTNTGSVTSTTYDPNPTNNSSSVTTSIAAQGGSSAGGILTTNQQLTVNSGTPTNTSGTVKVQTGTVPLTLQIAPQSQCATFAPGGVCKSDILDIEPHAVPAGQVLTAQFNTGRPSPFQLFPFVKFFINKNGVDKPLPLCRPYLKPQPLPDGSACEYLRLQNFKGEVIVFVALGAQDPRLHR